MGPEGKEVKVKVILQLIANITYSSKSFVSVWSRFEIFTVLDVTRS